MTDDLPSWRSLLPRIASVVSDSYSKTQLVAFSVLGLSAGPVCFGLLTGIVTGLFFTLLSAVSIPFSVVLVIAVYASVLLLTVLPIILSHKFNIEKYVLKLFRYGDPELKYASLFTMTYTFTLGVFSLVMTPIIARSLTSPVYNVSAVSLLFGSLFALLFSLGIGYFIATLAWEQPAELELMEEQKSYQTYKKLHQKEQEIRSAIEEKTGIPATKTQIFTKEVFLKRADEFEDEPDVDREQEAELA